MTTRDSFIGRAPIIAIDTVRATTAIARCRAYAPTPLLCIQALGRKVWLKDETDRFGLGSFKALGAVHGVAQLILKAARAKGAARDFADPADASLRDVARAMTFICASAGNHGVAVAAGARLFGARARVHLPLSAPQWFEQRLNELGAQVRRSGDAYDDAMNAAERDAQDCGGMLLSDRAASDDDEGPALVVEGYTVIAEELRAAFESMDVWPTHVFVQAGVGALAAAITFHMRRFWQAQPEIIIVEPASAACLAASFSSGRPMVVGGAVSIMHRLDCKAPSILALRILKSASVTYCTVTDEEALAANAALRELGVSTTPSGAAGFAALRALAPGLDAGTTRPLIFATERVPTNFHLKDETHA